MISMRCLFVFACLIYLAASYEKMYQQFPQHSFDFDMKQAAPSAFQPSVQGSYGGGNHGFDLKHSASAQGNAQYGQGSWWDGFRKGWEDGMKYVKNGGKTSHTSGLIGGGSGGHGGHQMALAQFSNQGHMHRI